MGRNARGAGGLGRDKRIEADEAQRQAAILARAHVREEGLRAGPLDTDASMEVAPGVFLAAREGLFVFDGKAVLPLTQALANSNLSKGKMAEKIFMPVPVVPTRHTISLPGIRASLRVNTTEPEFYMRTTDAREPQLRLIRARVRKDARQLENLDTLVDQQRETGDTVPIQLWEIAQGVFSVPLSSANKLDYFSPEFQSLVTDKGAMILHMLRWVVGEKRYLEIMRDFATKYAGKSASTDDFRELSEKVYGEKLTWFYSQWMDSTSAPEFKAKYTCYRLGNNKGFRIVGAITQDLDLFRMPVNLRIDTDGRTEEKRIEVVGTDSPFSVETFGRPRRITVDPENRVLTNSRDIKLRSSIVRGQGLIQQGDLAGALSEFNKALEVNKNSSLAHYRIAEVFYMQKNYQASANAYRSSLNGDGEPRWTEVWSHLQLGKIFDVTGQRERAVNEYRQAIQTNDNTQGALEECRRYMQKPFEREKGS